MNPSPFGTSRDWPRTAFDPREIEIPCLAAQGTEKVAIIGSGPAGLSAAYHLARNGVRSTIFEALPKPGGMLRVGIPDHRLPGDILDREIEIITRLGVDIQTNRPLGPNLSVDDLSTRVQFGISGLGAHKESASESPEEEAEGISSRR